MQATVLGLRRDRVRESATRRTPETPARAGWITDRTSFHDIYDVVVVVCFLALIALVVFGGALMFLSRVTAILAVSPRVDCSEVDDCAVTAPDTNKAVLVDDDWVYGPKLTR